MLGARADIAARAGTAQCAPALMPAGRGVLLWERAVSATAAAVPVSSAERPLCWSSSCSLQEHHRDRGAPRDSSSAVGLFPLSLRQRKKAAGTETNREALAFPVPGPACPVRAARPKNKNIGYSEHCEGCEQI